jgi:putative DNA primase/helicase
MLKETSAFKGLTGHDLISANRKNKSYINFVNYAKMVFCANEIPYTRDSTNAFFNRWIIIEFPYTFISEKEYNYLDELYIIKNGIKKANISLINSLTTEEELSGLLNWALDGLKQLMDKGEFSYSKTTDDVKNLWIRKSDSLTAFIQDFCTTECGFDDYITKSIFRSTYQKYCNEHKIKVFTDKTISDKFKFNYDVEDTKLIFDGSQVRVWKGIKFK